MPTFLSRFALFAFTTTLFAHSPFVGTWKPDTAKTKFSAGDPGQNVTVFIEEQGDRLWVTTTATTADGSPFSLKYMIPIKVVSGRCKRAPADWTALAQKLSALTFERTALRGGGKPAALRRWVVSNDIAERTQERGAVQI